MRIGNGLCAICLLLAICSQLCAAAEGRYEKLVLSVWPEMPEERVPVVGSFLTEVSNAIGQQLPAEMVDTRMRQLLRSWTEVTRADLDMDGLEDALDAEVASTARAILSYPDEDELNRIVKESQWLAGVIHAALSDVFRRKVEVAVGLPYMVALDAGLRQVARDLQATRLAHVQEAELQRLEARATLRMIRTVLLNQLEARHVSVVRSLEQDIRSPWNIQDNLWYLDVDRDEMERRVAEATTILEAAPLLLNDSAYVVRLQNAVHAFIQDPDLQGQGRAQLLTVVTADAKMAAAIAFRIVDEQIEVVNPDLMQIGTPTAP
ncbi:MAG: hypothetical protein PF961_18050 [Planctomycetota bacterium]|jgi:hypothetical protein|nr:hypothetical protein [Planctomycetota bacterium]